jgi:hypothetical protein
MTITMVQIQLRDYDRAIAMPGMAHRAVQLFAYLPAHVVPGWKSLPVMPGYASLGAGAESMDSMVVMDPGSPLPVAAE